MSLLSIIPCPYTFIVVAMSAWTSYIRLLSVRRVEALGFYEAEALRCGWTTRKLDRQMNSQLYGRITLSRKRAATLRKSETAQTGNEISLEEAIRTRSFLNSF